MTEVQDRIAEFKQTHTYPKTIIELDNLLVEEEQVLVDMAELTVELKATKDFSENFCVDYSYSTLRDRLKKRGWTDTWHKDNCTEIKSTETKELEISRSMLKDTKKLQNKISADTYDRLQNFFNTKNISKEDMPKLLTIIIEKGLSQVEFCDIYYQQESRIKIS